MPAKQKIKPMPRTTLQKLTNFSAQLFELGSKFEIEQVCAVLKTTDGLWLVHNNEMSDSEVQSLLTSVAPQFKTLLESAASLEVRPLE